MIFTEYLLFYISSSLLNLIFKFLQNVVIVSFSALNLSVIVRIGDNNATLSKSVALDMATYGKPLVNDGKVGNKK